jgi:hypothetical protein
MGLFGLVEASSKLSGGLRTQPGRKPSLEHGLDLPKDGMADRVPGTQQS